MFIWILLVITSIICILVALFAGIYFWDNGKRYMHINRGLETYRYYLDNIPSYGKAWSYFIMDYYIPSSNIKPFKGVDKPFMIENEISGDRLIPLIKEGNDILSDVGINNVFLINLNRSSNRLERSLSMYKQLGVKNLTRMNAFDGRNEVDIMKNELQEFSVHSVDDLGKLNTFLDIISYKKLLAGHQGCTCSHIYLWKYIYQNNIPVAIISEDDVCFHPNFKKLFIESWQNRPDGVLYNYNLTKTECSNCDKYSTPTWVKGAGGSATFYVITWEGAKRLLAAFCKNNFPILPCADDIPFMTLPDSYKLYYNNNNVFKDIPLCGDRHCGIVSTPNSEDNNSTIREVN